MPEDTQQLIREHQEKVCAFIESRLGVPMKVTRETRLEGAIIDAIGFLSAGAPHTARAVLEGALKEKV